MYGSADIIKLWDQIDQGQHIGRVQRALVMQQEQPAGDYDLHSHAMQLYPLCDVTACMPFGLVMLLMLSSGAACMPLTIGYYFVRWQLMTVATLTV